MCDIIALVYLQLNESVFSNYIELANLQYLLFYEVALRCYFDYKLEFESNFWESI